MANKYIQVGVSAEVFDEFAKTKKEEDRSDSKMGEILIREALANRRLLKQKAA